MRQISLTGYFCKGLKLYAKKMGLGITIYCYGGGSENGLTKPLTGEL